MRNLTGQVAWLLRDLPPSIATGLRRTSLDTADSPAGVDWQLSPLTGVPAAWSAVGATPIPATVPGEVVADLLAAELIPDPFDGDNEDRLHWIGSTDWSYRTTFTFQPGDEPASRSRLRRPRHHRHGGAERHRGGPDSQPAPQLPVRRHRPAGAREQRPRGPLRGSGHRGPAPVRRARRPPARVRAPVQRDPQDGRRLRLGLGSRPRRGRHLALGRDRVVERRPAGLGASAGPARRHHRSAGDPRRAGVGRHVGRRGRGRGQAGRPERHRRGRTRADRGRARADRPRRRAVVAAAATAPRRATT